MVGRGLLPEWQASRVVFLLLFVLVTLVQAGSLLGLAAAYSFLEHDPGGGTRTIGLMAWIGGVLVSGGAVLAWRRIPRSSRLAVGVGSLSLQSLWFAGTALLAMNAMAEAAVDYSGVFFLTVVGCGLLSGLGLVVAALLSSSLLAARHEAR